MITGRPTCFHRFYIDVSHPKWLLLEVHRYEVEVAQDSRLDSFMSLQHLVSSSYDARISYPHWLGHVKWLVSGGDHESAMYISDLFALPPVPPRWPVRCSHSCFTGEFPTSLSGKAGQSLEEWWHFGGPCRLWHWGAFGLGFDRFSVCQLLLYHLKRKGEMDVYLCVIETKAVPKLETTMKMNEVLHIIQVIRCDHFILHPKLASKY